MTKFFKTLWRVITFPFVLIFNIIAFPFRSIRRMIGFLNTEPEDRPLIDTFTGLATEAEMRQSLWDHVEELRGHLLRIVIALAVGVGISFSFTKSLMEFLALPVGGLEKLQAIQVTEEIGVFMRVALTSGIAIMLPYIAFELWLFAAPGPQVARTQIRAVRYSHCHASFSYRRGLYLFHSPASRSDASWETSQPSPNSGRLMNISVLSRG